MKRIVILLAVVVLLLGFTVSAAFADSPVQSAAEQYFAGGTKNMKAADLYANLNDGDTSNDPFLVDIRAAADFANGHIKGATNIAGKDLFTADNLAKLPKDKSIVRELLHRPDCQPDGRRVADDGLRRLQHSLWHPLLGHE